MMNFTVALICHWMRARRTHPPPPERRRVHAALAMDS
jgi:hypothetical protein